MFDYIYWVTENTYDLELEINGYEFRKSLIENNKGLSKPSTSGNSSSIIIMEQILWFLRTLNGQIILITPVID